MTICRILALCLLFATALPRPAACSTDSVLAGLSSLVDKYLKYDERHARAKEDAWYPQPFTDTKASTRSDLDALLDKALQILLDDEVLEVRHGIGALMRTNVSLHERIADLEMRRLTAPAETRVYEVWKKNVGEIEREIADSKAAIAENERKVAALKQSIRDRLAAVGITLSAAEVDSLVNTVSGTDTLQAMVVLKNVRAVLTKLQGVLAGSGENIHIAKKYFGLFLLATEAYLKELEKFGERIDAHYLAGLGRLREENRKLMRETERLAAQDPKYRNNLQAQRLTEQAAETYEGVLLAQKKMVAQRTAQVRKIFTLAENTYRTVSIAHSLYQSMSEGLSSYESLMELPLIEAVPFANKDLENKFLELTRSLGG